MKSPGDVPESVAMKLILWSRSRDSLPKLTRSRWQRVAASLYRNCVMAESRRLNPLASLQSPAESWYKDHSVRWTRLICGALASRARSQGWEDLARQWADRYWVRTSSVDGNDELRTAITHVIDIEDVVRASYADFPER